MSLSQGRLWDDAHPAFIHSHHLKLERLTEAPGAASQVRFSTQESTLGPIRIFSVGESIFRLDLLSESTDRYTIDIPAGWQEQNEEVHRTALKFLESRTWKGPVIPLALYGTEFQLKVWKAVADIPYGQHSTYGAIATSLGDPNLSRAVGAAVGNNPVAVLIPCHRVLAANGKSGEFRWGKGMKRRLLARERDSIPGLKKE